MKRIGDILGIAGILLALYTLIGRFIGGPTVGFGLVEIQAKSMLATANSMMLISLLIRTSGK